jgi:hypothetical protein
MDEKKDIKRFISNITNKNYSEANQSLQKMIETKLKTRIKQSQAQEN